MSDEASFEAFVSGLEGQLGGREPDDKTLLGVLDTILGRFGCATGTIHKLDPASGLLTLRVQRGIPDAIMDRVRSIPIGKGMAGLAAQRREPVQMCNLPTDDSGVAKPGAKLTQMEGSIAIPMLVDGAVRGTLGVAKPEPYEFGPQESEQLLHLAAQIGQRFAE